MRLILPLLFFSFSGTAQFYNILQVMHNSADTSVKHLKLWINDTIWVSQFDYLQSTPMVKLSQGIHTVGVSFAGATSQAQSISQATIDNSMMQGNYNTAFMAVCGIHDPGPQYNPGSSIKPFGIYTYIDSSLIGEPTPWHCRAIISHLSTDISSLTITSGTINFANNLGYKNTSSWETQVGQQPGSIANYTVSVSSPSGAIGTGTITLKGGTKINIVSTGFQDTLLNGRMSAGGKKMVLGVLPTAGGPVVEVPLTIPSTAGIEEISGNNAPRFYPSPARDRLFVDMKGYLLLDATIEDIHGKTVAWQKLSANESSMALKNLAPGVYFLKLSDGKTDFVSKFVVE